MSKKIVLEEIYQVVKGTFLMIYLSRAQCGQKKHLTEHHLIFYFTCLFWLLLKTLTRNKRLQD